MPITLPIGATRTFVTKKTYIADLKSFDMADMLVDEPAIEDYLTIVAEENDASTLAGALETVARARTMKTLSAAEAIKR